MEICTARVNFEESKCEAANSSGEPIAFILNQEPWLIKALVIILLSMA